MPEINKKRRRAYGPEFKQDAVDLVVKQGYSFRSAAEAVGVNITSLRNWHKRLYSAPEVSGETANSQELANENRRLRKELQRVEMERDILKKATAYFAKESR